MLRAMLATRSYGDPCGIARALDAVGERWALLIVRELALGPKRFTDLKLGLPSASPNVLSQRLRELVALGVIEKRSGRGGQAYGLTPWGEELHPLLLALGRWGARAPMVRGGVLGLDALLLALEATYVPKPDTPPGAVALLIDDQSHEARFDEAALRITRGVARDVAARVVCDGPTLRAVVFGDRALADAALVIEGDKVVARRFLRSFARPAPHAGRA